MIEPPPEPLYRFIGGDQREYGPVTADQIRQWIAEGRASGATQVLREGETEWRPLSALPEFADALAQFTPPPESGPTPTPITGLEPLSLLEDYVGRADALDIGWCLTRSWGLLKRHFGLLVGSSAIFLLIEFGLGFIPIFGAVASLLFSLVLYGGMGWMCLKLVRRQPAQLGNMFDGFSINCLQLILAGIITNIGVAIGYILCILPGIYLTVAWLTFSPLLIMDKQMEFWPALELNRRLVNRCWWNIFALMLISLVLNIAGALLCGIGLVVALPLATGVLVYAYEDIFGVPGAT